MSMSCAATLAAERPCAAAKPPKTRPQMIAAKVAPSTSALPETSSSRRRMIGQDAVFDRAEQRRNDSEPEQSHIEQRRRGERETGGGDHLNEDLREFEPPGDQSLIVRIGDLAAERRKRDRGQDENDRREQDFEAGVLAAEAEENEHDQHIADEIVVERGEELAPEQRR